MISNMKLMNSGTGLSLCGASACGVSAAPRQGTGVSASVHAQFGPRRVERTQATFGIDLVKAAAVIGAYPQVDADLPTIKQFRVPLSIRERSS
ncbi:hypothetical protein [Amycolatopsis sp. PS_44_ISF1]|uniref:hypothetical protein n=1 Tax=Amycolatopsis sp. PS_44_ISF1 TaxID=2974917 RepID=UPI0028DDD423|nr:hypothetical protein [Amycolatopsis sp. PS_44_ISF1]MDT8915828.1 hypothetical protein [Amycolatopsis sp. PS_44_ISF1]